MKKKKGVNYAKWGYLFILPFFVIYFIFSLVPLADTVRFSFYEYAPKTTTKVVQLKKLDQIL